VQGVSLVATLIYIVITVFIVLMWVRFALDLAATYARQWRPRGAVLVIAEAVYAVTDPPVKAVRRVVPPVRLGGVAIDFSWSIVLLLALILSYVVFGFMN